MLKLFREKLSPARPLSDAWLEKNATPYIREDFEDESRSMGAVPIFHVTDLRSAQSIYGSNAIFGIDVVNSAHFHYTPQGANGQAIADGVLLGFTWHGPVVTVDLSNNRSSHVDQRPNILFDVPISEFRKDTWELRLYPGTVGLKLNFIGYGQKQFLLNEPREISVVHGQ